MNLITDYFELNKKQSDIDFVDVNMDGDSKLFINPALLCESTDVDISLIGPKKVDSFFKKIFELYIAGHRRQALDELFENSKESNANHLGYSKGYSRGNGASKQALAKLFDTIQKTGALAQDIMIQPISILIFAHDFGPDRMSDLIVSILKKELVSYTLKEAKRLNIPIESEVISYGEYWDCETSSWQEISGEWVKGSDGKPLIFTPKQTVSSQYGFSVNDYVRKTVWTWRKSYHVEKQTSLARTKYDDNGKMSYVEPTSKTLQEEEIDKPYGNVSGKWKLYALEMTIQNPKLYSQYFGNFTNTGLINKNKSLTDDELSDIVKNS